jgi:hypothetical protein
MNDDGNMDRPKNMYKPILTQFLSLHLEGSSGATRDSLLIDGIFNDMIEKCPY